MALRTANHCTTAAPATTAVATTPASTAVAHGSAAATCTAVTTANACTVRNPGSTRSSTRRGGKSTEGRPGLRAVVTSRAKHQPDVQSMKLKAYPRYGPDMEPRARLDLV